jgi:dephospho-CoA kinase
MSRWPGKYVIGLTGNIAVGKSVVRKMLEHLGAFGIDADEVAHRAMSSGGPAFEQVIRLFGEWILGNTGEIDRKALGRLAFADPRLLDQLEEIMHPLVIEAVDLLVRRSHAPVIVLEAIKLFETELDKLCDTVWVVDAPTELQQERLMNKRGMTEATANQRIAVQPPQSEKLARAKVIIRNRGSFEETWDQVLSAWNAGGQPAEPAAEPEVVKGKPGIRRGRPNDADAIATFINRITRREMPLTRADVMAAFGQKAYFLIEEDRKIMGAIGWQVENLVARADEVLLDPGIPVDTGLPMLLQAMETASADLQAEAAIVFSDPKMSASAAWKQSGYKQVKADKLGVKAWEEAVKESSVPGTTMLFKQLREDRILRPI